MRPLRTFSVLAAVALVVLPAARAAAAAGGPVALVVNTDDAALSWEHVQPAIAEATGAPVVATDDPRARDRRGLLTVTWRPSRHELAVTYEDARGTISRVVPAPADAAAALSTAAALAANLVRDQAAEALGAAPEAKESPATSSEAPPAGAPPPPAPDLPVRALRRDTGYTPPSTPPRILPRWLVSLSLGTGVGVVTGSSDLFEAKPSPGLAWGQLGQIVPEVGFRIAPALVLSLAARLQVLTTTTDRKLPMSPENSTECGGDYVCTVPRNAFALLAKATFADWRPERAIVPYFSFVLGAGEIRHPVSLQSVKSCGAMGTSTCVDSVNSGPVFAGAGVGLRLPVNQAFSLVTGLEALFGTPHFTFNVDASVGAAVAF